MPRVRLYSQIPIDGTRSLLDGNGTQPETVEFITSKLSGETETFTVIVYDQKQSAVVLRKFYHDMGSLSMLFFVVVALGKTTHQVNQIGGLNSNRTQIGDKVPKLGGFVSHCLLEAGQGGFG